MTYAYPLLEPVSRPMPRRIGVVGAGTIGPDIAYYLKSALPALELVLLDVRQSAIDAALARLRGYADKAVARGKMGADDAAAPSSPSSLAFALARAGRAGASISTPAARMI